MIDLKAVLDRLRFIIVVGVALETVKALENQMLMRQYKGFLE